MNEDANERHPFPPHTQSTQIPLKGIIQVIAVLVHLGPRRLHSPCLAPELLLDAQADALHAISRSSIATPTAAPKSFKHPWSHSDTETRAATLARWDLFCRRFESYANDIAPSHYLYTMRNVAAPCKNTSATVDGGVAAAHDKAIFNALQVALAAGDYR